MLYFPHLCRAAQKNWRKWAEKYGERPTPNLGYITLNVYPLRTEVVDAINKIALGTVLLQNAKEKEEKRIITAIDLLQALRVYDDKNSAITQKLSKNYIQERLF